MKYLKIAVLICIIALLTASAGGIFFYQRHMNGVLILEYHKVNDTDSDEYTTRTKDFMNQMEYLSEQGYKTISLMDFVKAEKYKEKLPDKSVILTFDDGYEDSYTNVMPILAEHGMKGTVFVITNYIGEKGYLTWDQLKTMQQLNIELGSHTANHLPLTTLPSDKINDEIKLSKLLMEWNGIKTIYFFSYPNGAYNDTAREDLKSNEYLAAVTGDPGLNTFSNDPYLLKRTYMPRMHFGLLEFKLRLLKSMICSEFGISI